MSIGLGFGTELFWHQSISCPKGIPGMEGRSRADSGITSVKSTCHPCHYCSLPSKGVGSCHSWGNQSAAQGAACTPKLQHLQEKKIAPSSAASRTGGGGEGGGREGYKAQPCEGGGLSWTCHTPAAKAEAKPIPKQRAAGPSALQSLAFSLFMQLQSLSSG